MKKKVFRERYSALNGVKSEMKEDKKIVRRGRKSVKSSK